MVYLKLVTNRFELLPRLIEVTIHQFQDAFAPQGRIALGRPKTAFRVRVGQEPPVQRGHLGHGNT